MRRRVIDPAFWSDSKITELSFNARLLYIGLWQYADDEGLFLEDLKNIKMTLFPDQCFPLEECYGELRDAGFFRFGGLTDDSVRTQTRVKVAEIRHFKDHQTINRPTPSKLRERTTFNDDSLSTHSQVKLSKEKIGDSVNDHSQSHTEPDKQPPHVDVSSPKKKSKPSRAVPLELQPAVSKIIGRINDLAGTNYRPDSQMVIQGLVARFSSGATEAECIAVVEDRHRAWRDKPEMQEYFNPETLFREGKFEKYKNAALMNGNQVRKEHKFVNA